MQKLSRFYVTGSIFSEYFLGPLAAKLLIESKKLGKCKYGIYFLYYCGEYDEV